MAYSQNDGSESSHTRVDVPPEDPPEYVKFSVNSVEPFANVKGVVWLGSNPEILINPFDGFVMVSPQFPGITEDVPLTKFKTLLLKRSVKETAPTLTKAELVIFTGTLIVCPVAAK